MPIIGSNLQVKSETTLYIEVKERLNKGRPLQMVRWQVIGRELSMSCTVLHNDEIFRPNHQNPKSLEMPYPGSVRYTVQMVSLTHYSLKSVCLKETTLEWEQLAKPTFHQQGSG